MSIKAIYESEIIRPFEPLEFAEGTRLHIIVIPHEKSQRHVSAAEILAEIAALPLEGRPILIPSESMTSVSTRKSLLHDLH